jgi:hypothetical protein
MKGMLSRGRVEFAFIVGETVAGIDGDLVVEGLLFTLACWDPGLLRKMKKARITVKAKAKPANVKINL